MSNKMLATKLKRRVAAIDHSIVPIDVRNVDINGRKVGCSGFFYCPDTNRMVYATTDVQCCTGKNDTAYLRYAKSERDYRGGANRHVDEERLAESIAYMLRDAPESRVDAICEREA